MAKHNLVVGRSRDCDIVLKDPQVSGHHARLRWEGQNILLEDLGSANGTQVNGQDVQRLHIRPGDEVLFGGVPLPWSHKKLRPFLRAGAGQTMLGRAMPQRKAFICGACGSRAEMPAGFEEGVLRCPSCAKRVVVEKPPSKIRVALGWMILIALIGAGVYWWQHHDGAAQVREQAEVIREAVEENVALAVAPAAGSPQEASIRRHSAPRVTEAIDAESPETRNAAVQIASAVEGPFSVEQVAHIWRHVHREWSYVNDPHGNDYFARASESIANDYAGDCDDFAIVLSAMIGAIGGKVRIVMMDGPRGGHAYTEVCLEEDPRDLATKLNRYYRRNRHRGERLRRVRSVHFRPGAPEVAEGAPAPPPTPSSECPLWFNLDWNAGTPGGPYEDETWAVAVYPDGRTETLAPASAP